MSVGFTKRELCGTPWELTIGFAALFGAPAVALYGQARFSPFDANHPLFMVVSLAVVVVAWALCIVFRKTLMPWGQKVPFIMWLSTLGLAVLPGMATFGALLIINGAFDRSSTTEVHAQIVRKFDRSRQVALRSPSWPTVRVSLSLTRAELETAKIGDGVRLQIGSGALGVPWIAGHSLVMQPRVTR